MKALRGTFCAFLLPVVHNQEGRLAAVIRLEAGGQCWFAMELLVGVEGRTLGFHYLQ